MKRCYFSFLEPLVAGLLFAWGFPLKGFPSFFLAPIVALILLSSRLTLLSPDKSTHHLGKDFLRVWIFSLGAWLLGYAWIPETLRIFGEIVFPFNYLLGSLASLLILPQFFALLFCLYALSRLVKKEGLRFFLLKPLTLAGAMVLIEEFLPQLFPTHLGHPWLSLAPYLGLAPYVGVPLFSFFSYWLGFEVLSFVKEKRLPRLRVAFLCVPFLLFLLLNILFPLKYVPQEGKGLELRLVQVNIESYLKLASEKGSTRAVSEVFKKYIDTTLTPREKPLDLLIWPETAYPYTVDTRLWQSGEKALPEIFDRVGGVLRADMVWGGYEWGAPANDDDFETTYNGTFHFAYDPIRGMSFKNVYRKMRLIPFGETLPFGPLNPLLGSVIKNISYFKKGQNYQLFTTKKETRFISAICYEILFSSFVRDYLKAVPQAPHFLVNLTNDSWYGDTNEPLQHLFLAKWRALEFDLPLIRSTNSGISGVFYPDGTEEKRLEYGVQGALDLELKLKERSATLYERFGFGVTFLIWGVLSLLSFLAFDRKAFAPKIMKADKT